MAPAILDMLGGSGAINGAVNNSLGGSRAAEMMNGPMSSDGLSGAMSRMLGDTGDQGGPDSTKSLLLGEMNNLLKKSVEKIASEE